MGSKQLGFGDYEQATAKKRTKRERFLSEMENVVPWKALLDLIEPHYPKTSPRGGRPIRCRPCCASISFSRGTTSAIQRWRMR
jgi:hypothetical protein